MPPKVRNEAKAQAQKKKRSRKPDDDVLCPHTCCSSRGPYRKGQSSAWIGHVSNQSNRTHTMCTPNCPGWKFLHQPLNAPDGPRQTPSPTNLIVDSDQPRNRVFTLLWILDPTSSSACVESTEDQSQWYDVSLREEDKELLQDETLTGFIFGKPNDEARICEYVDLYRRLPSASYAKSIMLFSEFQKMVLADEEEKLKMFDVVILPFIAIDLWSANYNLKDGQVTTYLKKLAQLESNGVHFWPTFKECYHHADKVTNVHRFDDIAAEITRSPRPKTKAPVSIKDAAKEEKGVVKRSFADKSEHVYYLPKDRNKLTKSIAKEETQFLWQQFIPSLKSYGELRLGISFDEVIWRVWTLSHEGDDDTQYEFCDVTHPKRILNVPIAHLPEDPFDNDYNQIAPIYLKNLQDIDDFAVRTLQELIRLETLYLGYEPSLSTFARLDLGIMADEDGKAQFFVNEVEILPNVTIWRGEDHAGPVAAAMDHTIYTVTLRRHQRLGNEAGA